MADVAGQAPDHVALTGDLVNFAAPREIAAAAAWLAAHAAPDRLTVSPGNHDALVAGGPDPLGAWRPWMQDGEGDWPHVRLRGEVALINLSTAVPTPIGSAQGRLGAGQAARLAEALDALGREGRLRVLLLHHPVAPGAVPRRKRLVDAAALAAAVGRHGAELVLHGHAHRSGFAALKGPRGPVPVLGVPSASAVGGRSERARWALIDIGEGAITVRARALLPDGGFDEVGRYRLLAGER